MTRLRTIKLNESVCSSMKKDGDRVREELERKGTFLINLMSSPGAGKTTTLVGLINRLKASHRLGVIEADLDSRVDADKVSSLTGVPSIQIHTDSLCHVDSGMVEEALKDFPEGLDLLFLENVGNLVCPAELDTGAHLNLMIRSVPEGHDKPLKYPLIFQRCSAMIVNKTDVLPYFDFDLDKVTQFARQRNPGIQIFPISAKTGEGVEALAAWICAQIDKEQEKKETRL